MVIGQHGSFLFRARSLELSCFLPGVCGHDIDNPVCEFARGHARLLLLDIWPAIWAEADGSEPLLFWMVRGED